MMRARSRGFTLIELLVVIIVLAILVTIVIPRFFSTKEKAMVATMRSDLRNMTSAQAAYFDDNQTYASDVSQLQGMFAPSKNVSLTIDSASTTGWGASASYAGTAVVCEVAVSDAGASAPACSRL